MSSNINSQTLDRSGRVEHVRIPCVDAYDFEDVLHLLDFMRIFVMPSGSCHITYDTQRSCVQVQCMPSAPL